MIKISILAPGEFFEGMADLEPVDGAELSEPIPADSLSDALDSPLSPDLILQFLEVCTALFATGTAALAFFEKILDILRVQQIEKIYVIRHDANDKHLEITNKTTIEDVESLLDQ